MSVPLLEEELSYRWNRCVNDTLIKTSTGATLGILFKYLIARNRTWPILVGIAIGTGIGYQYCEKELRDSLTICRDHIRNPDKCIEINKQQ